MNTGFAWSDDIRGRNRRRVIAAVRRHGATSRTDIARLTGLSAASVSTITNDFIAEGVLARLRGSGDAKPGGRGRPKERIGLDRAAALIGIVVFQLNAVSATVVDYSGATVASARRVLATRGAEPGEIRSVLIACLSGALADAPAGTLRQIAVGVQGATDIEGTSLLWSPVTRERGLPIASWLRTAFDVPATVSNDCDLMAQALNWRDPVHYGVNFAAVLLSHGVGMGLFLRGTLVNGTRSSATEFGHVIHIPGGALCRCGRRGCIEAYAGDYAIERQARGNPPDAPPPDLAEGPDIAAIAAAARAGDGRARGALEAAGEALGTGLAGLYALVDPFPVALVGVGTLAFDLIERPLREALGRTMGGGDATDVAIDCFSDETPLICEGAAVNALRHLDDAFATPAGSPVLALPA